MERRKNDLAHRLLMAVQDLPEDKVAEILDFTEYLHGKYAERRPERGSPEAILHDLAENGPLQFEPGELDALLDDIEQARDSDLEEHSEPMRL